MKFLKFLLVFLLPLAAIAGVSLKNGNFYISYTDILVPGGGHDLKVVRTYNSRATETGWFGFGWGSDYETFITVSADGSVVVHENGSGALTRFPPKEAVDPAAARAATERRHPAGRMGTPDDIAGLAVYLASSESSFVSGSCYTIDGGLTAQSPISPDDL